MLIKIEIIAVSSPQTIKSYKQIEVTYKDLDKGKVNAKKVMSFSYPEVYNTLSKAEKGDILGIEIKKEGEYWNWVAIGEASVTDSVPEKKELAPTRVTGGDNWETKEERQQRQIYIIRQSCLGNAVEFLKESGADKNDIFSLAADMEQWVLRKDPMKEIINMPDDVIE